MSLVQVIAQCEKYVREFGAGVIIFRDGYVKCPLTSPPPDSGYRYVDWQVWWWGMVGPHRATQLDDITIAHQDRPRLPAAPTPHTPLAGLRHGEASDEAQGGLEWESRYRLPQSREIG